MERPDLSQVDPRVRAYIEYLEKRLKIGQPSSAESDPVISDAPLPAEAPTTIQIISISKNNLARRTARHLYPRQHRGGMGVTDFDLPVDDLPAGLAIAEEDQHLLLFTNRARVFRQPVTRMLQTGIRSTGEDIFERAPLEPGEYVAAALPVRASGYVALLSQWGRVRSLRHHLFGEHMRPGTTLFRPEEFGPLASACWTPGDRDLFIASANSQAIRFGEKLLNPQGELGLKLGSDDRAVAITTVDDDSQVFLIGANGKGTLRPMAGFAANKSPGGSGKIAMKTDRLVAAFSVDPEDEIFLMTRLGKTIRFRVDEVPAPEGVVQGVFCMGLRGDEVMLALRSTPTLDL